MIKDYENDIIYSENGLVICKDEYPAFIKRTLYKPLEKPFNEYIQEYFKSLDNNELIQEIVEEILNECLSNDKRIRKNGIQSRRSKKK